MGQIKANDQLHPVLIEKSKVFLARCRKFIRDTRKIKELPQIINEAYSVIDLYEMRDNCSPLGENYKVFYVWALWQFGGRKVYYFNVPMLNSMKQIDIEAVMFSQIVFPSSCFYMDVSAGQYTFNNQALQGVYIMTDSHYLHFYFATDRFSKKDLGKRRYSVQLWFPKMNWDYIDPAFTLATTVTDKYGWHDLKETKNAVDIAVRCLLCFSQNVPMITEYSNLKP